MSDLISQQAFKLLQELMAQGFANVTTSIDDLKASINAELARGAKKMDDHEIRIKTLETWRSGLEGERRGVAMSVKIVWSLVGGAVVAGVAAILEMTGFL